MSYSGKKSSPMGIELQDMTLVRPRLIPPNRMWYARKTPKNMTHKMTNLQKMYNNNGPRTSVTFARKSGGRRYRKSRKSRKSRESRKSRR